jgi:hypothetical protein
MGASFLLSAEQPLIRKGLAPPKSSSAVADAAAPGLRGSFAEQTYIQFNLK